MAPRVAALAFVLGTGCSAVFGLEPPAHEGLNDAPASPDPDSLVDACPSLSTVVSTCGMTFTGDFSLGSGDLTYNTDTRTFQPNFGGTLPSYEFTTATGPIIVLAFHGLTLGSNSNLRVLGSKPLALIVEGAFTLSGTIDVGVGGANHRTCDAVAGVAGNGGAGGGGGGGFASIGGTGGDGNIDGTVHVGGNAGTAQSRPSAPRGGCDGGIGGDAGGSGGTIGRGGGAILIAAGSIQVSSNGRIDASGGGGGGGKVADSGAGGGGSGGFILLETASLQIDGTVVANGGGGGEGGDASTGGNPGARSSTINAAPGGSGNSIEGGDGGAGGAAMSTAGHPSNQQKNGGGGGGGGGVGFISFRAPQVVITSGSVISPAQLTWP